MAQEKEIKIRLTTLSLDAFLKRIGQAGFVFEKTSQQEDIYFDTPDWYLYEHIAALRIRKVGGQARSLAFKKVFYMPGCEHPYYIEELETDFPLQDQVVLHEILRRLGITPPAHQLQTPEEVTAFLRSHKYLDEQHMPKTRRSYARDDNEIVVDDIDGIGIVIELECKRDEPKEVAAELLDRSEWEGSTEGTSYMWLSKHKGLYSHLHNMERLKTEAGWNVWPTEREWFEQLASTATQ